MHLSIRTRVINFIKSWLRLIYKISNAFKAPIASSRKAEDMVFSTLNDACGGN